MACGLAAIIATVSPALASESPASAAADANSRHVPHAAETRDIRHERHIQGIRERRGGEQARKARPWTITVPSIGVAAHLVPLGAPDGSAGPDALSLPVPPLAKAATETGWYQFTAVPGAAGNAVIVGHVDTYIGPAVFYNLYLLRPGAPVYVVADGTRQRFDVTSVRELPKPSFPVSQVFGSTKRHMLWLITCGGAFDYATRHYLDNIVVSASWVPGHGKVSRHTRERARRTRLESLGNGTLVAITVEDGSIYLAFHPACPMIRPVRHRQGEKIHFRRGKTQ
jgi:Sortase domain